MPRRLTARYPVPQIQDFTANLAGARIVSKINLVRVYHLIPVHTYDTPKTAVITEVMYPSQYRGVN